MLNSASDYEFVNVSDVGSFIHGQPLPARTTFYSSSGNKATCAYEDYLFLLEAYYERMNYDQDGQNNITPANRVVAAADARPLYWTRNVGSFPGWNSYPYFINPNAVLPTGLVELSSSSSYVTEAIQNYAWTKSSTQYWPQSKSTRSLEHWASLFYDYHMMSKSIENKTNIAAGGFITSFTGTNTTRNYRSDGSYSESSTSFNFNSTIEGWAYYYAGSTSGSGSETIYTPNIQWPTTVLYAPHATDAKILVKFRHIQENRAWCLPVDLTVNNGTITLTDTSWVASTVQQILNITGYPYVTQFNGYGQVVESPITTIYMGGIMLIVDFDFPADYTSWNWSPS